MRRIVRTVITAFAIVLAGSPATAQSRKVLGWRSVGGGVGLAVSTLVRGSRWSCRRPGREGGPEEPPARGVVRIRGRSSMAPVAIGSIIGSHEQSCKSARALPRSAVFPVGADSPGDARAAPWADRAR